MPEYMVPSAIVILPAFPRTPNGKLDRRALPAPDYNATREANAVFVGPRTPLEAKLAKIWQEVLGVERVGIHDNFLALGGESLLALRIVNRLRGMLSENISLAVIFDSPTVALLAETLQKTYPHAVDGVPADQATPAGTGAEQKTKPDVIPRLSRNLHRASVAIAPAVRKDE
jgi:hypothetical protein